MKLPPPLTSGEQPKKAADRCCHHKVLFFLPNSVGGAERMTITIGNILHKNDDFSVLFVVVGKKMNHVKPYMPDECNVKLLHVRSAWLFLITKMVLLMVREKPDAVFSSIPYLNFRLIIAGRLCKVKTIIREAGIINVQPLHNRFFMKLTYRWAYRIIMQQEQMRETLLRAIKVNERQVVVRHNPIDVERIQRQLKDAISPYPRENQTNYVWVGRFSEQKGQDILVQAFSFVAGVNHDAHLYLVGRYSDHPNFTKKVKDYVDKNGITNRVHFVGHDDNPYRWMKYADCFVLPSRREGLPNALVEAMFIGTPVVAARCIPMIDNIVRDGYNGYIVNPENPKALADGMINAVHLHDFTFTYTPSSDKDFIELFR